MGNSADIAIATFGVQAAGAQVVPLNPAYTASELATDARGCRARRDRLRQRDRIDRAAAARGDRRAVDRGRSGRAPPDRVARSSGPGGPAAAARSRQPVDPAVHRRHDRARQGRRPDPSRGRRQRRSARGAAADRAGRRAGACDHAAVPRLRRLDGPLSRGELPRDAGRRRARTARRRCSKRSIAIASRCSARVRRSWSG